MKNIFLAVLFIFFVPVFFTIETRAAKNNKTSDQLILKQGKFYHKDKVLKPEIREKDPVLLLAKGRDYFNKGDFRKASACWTKALHSLKPAENADTYLDTSMHLANAFQGMGYYQKALSALKNAFPIAKESQDRYRNAQFFSTLGDIYLCLGKADYAMAYLNEAMKESRLSKNPRILANVLINAGNTLAAEGDYKGAMLSFEECLELNQNSGDPDLKSRALLNMARSAFHTRDYQRAYSIACQAFQHISSMPDSRDKVSHLLTLSLLAGKIREKNLNIRIYHKDDKDMVPGDIPVRFVSRKQDEHVFNIPFGSGSYKISGKTKKRLGKVKAFLNKQQYQAVCVMIKGHASPSKIRKNKYYKSNLELSKKRAESVERYLARKLKKPSKTSKTHRAWIYSLLINKFSEKQKALEQKKNFLKKYPGIQTWIKEKRSSGKSTFFFCAGRAETVHEAEEFSMNTFGRKYPAEKVKFVGIRTDEDKYILYKEGVAGLEGTLKSAAATVRIIPLGSEDMTEKIELGDEIRDILSKNKLKLQFNYEIKEHTKRYRHLTSIIRKSLDMAQNTGDKLKNYRLLSFVCGYIAQLHEQEKQYSKAEEMSRKAVSYASLSKSPEVMYRWQWHLARLYRQKKDVENAVRTYKEAISTLNPVRQEFFQGYRKKQDVFNENVKAVYLELAELLLNQAGVAKKANKEAEREQKLREARDTMELLKSAELQDFFEDECVAAGKTKPVTLNRTPARTALLYPIPLKHSLALLLTLPDGMSHISVDVDSKTLKKVVLRFRKRLQNRLSNRFMYDARKLYDWLIRPVEEQLRSHGIDTLVVAPDGALRLIPYATLHDGNQFLVENYAIGIIPGITLTNPKPSDLGNTEILLSGLSESRQGFSPLPGVSDELRDIRKIMNSQTLLMNKDYTVENLAQNLKNKDYGIIHIATHGIFGGTPEETFLLSYDGRLTMNRLEELVSSGKARNKNVELLALSACQTALGNERAALGLAGAAVKAGIGSVVATLWYVDDEATSLAIREFYRQIKTPGISKAKALQNAQKMLIEKPRFWQPLYWSPFILIGNWM